MPLSVFTKCLSGNTVAGLSIWWQKILCFFPITYTMFKANIFPAPTDGSFLLCARYADYRKSHFLFPHYSRAVGVEEMSDWCIWAEWTVRVPFSWEQPYWGRKNSVLHQRQVLPYQLVTDMFWPQSATFFFFLKLFGRCMGKMGAVDRAFFRDLYHPGLVSVERWLLQLTRRECVL